MSRQKKHLTKQEYYWILQYEKSDVHSIYEAYNRPSDEKIRIESDIRYRMRHDFNGSDYRILSHNGFVFSCAFLVEDGNNHFLICSTPKEHYHVVPLLTVDIETGEVKDWIKDYKENN